MRLRRLSRLPLGLIVPAALVVLVGSLAWLQYHWLGRVSEAERDRLQTSLRQRAEEFADEFDREVLHLYLSLQIDNAAVQRADWEGFNRSYETWRTSAKYPDMLRAVYLVEADRPDTTLRRFSTDTHAFAATSWPATLEPVRQRLIDAHARGEGSLSRGVLAGPGRSGSWAEVTSEARHLVALRNPVVGSVPALLIAVPAIQQQVTPSAEVKNLVSIRFNTTFVVAELDRSFLENTLLTALAARHFSERGGDSYVFAVVDSEDNGRTVFSRGLAEGRTIDRLRADASVPLFAIRYELAPQILTHLLSRGSAGASQVFRLTPGSSRPPGQQIGTMVRESTFSVFVQSPNGAAPPDAFNISTRPLGLAAWQLVIRHSAGSLDAAVAQARRRNLWLSFGILAVLAASVGLIVVNARRSERLAAQQMDFVATVSHELRTPLAVIRSAAQNLSAGVVHDPDQARRYGDLIETEGRRLTDMVEQVLEYAGLSGTRRAALSKPVDVGTIVRDTAAAHAPRLASEGFAMAVDVADDLPPVMADENGLRRAVDNLVSNAQKYGAGGGWIELAARRAASPARDEVLISVSDRGRGIEPDDLPHIFDPFYRGRHAIDQQIHGNGLGLSLVKRIAEAHGGRVSVQSAPSQGTVFTLHLPSTKTQGVISADDTAFPK